MPTRPDVPCSSCGALMWRGAKSGAVPGKSRCIPCRRKSHGLRADQSVNAAKEAARKRDACHRCGVPVPLGSCRWKFCSDECFRKARNARGSGAKSNPRLRGYDAAHVKLRAELLPLAYGTDCHLCGEVMERSQRLHLDHTEDRTGYRGMSHASCNVLDGARRGGETARQNRLAKGWRHGSSQGPRRRSAGTAA